MSFVALWLIRIKYFKFLPRTYCSALPCPCCYIPFLIYFQFLLNFLLPFLISKNRQLSISDFPGKFFSHQTIISFIFLILGLFRFVRFLVVSSLFNIHFGWIWDVVVAFKKLSVLIYKVVNALYNIYALDISVMTYL